MNLKNVQILKCPACGAANRIPADNMNKSPRCGKCHTELPPPKTDAGPSNLYTLRCTACGAKNRIPAIKIEDTPKCGKCKALLRTEELFVPQPVMVNDRNFDDRVLKSPLPVLLFAWASWCPTCVSVSPIIDELASEMKTKVRVGKLNVDQNPMMASKYKILSVPFIFIFDNGQLKESMPGGQKKHDLMMQMARYL